MPSLRIFPANAREDRFQWSNGLMIGPARRLDPPIERGDRLLQLLNRLQVLADEEAMM
jgi:hypothetical protein